MAGTTETFLHNQGVHHRVSSVAHPHSNCTAELGVKTVKRMLVGSTGPGGSQNTDAFQRAMIVYRNTPDPMSRVSAAEIIFGRRIRHFIPTPPGQYLPHWTWRETLEARKDAIRTCPTHEGTRATVRANTCSTSTGYRKLRKAAESTWFVPIQPNGTEPESLSKCDSLINTSYEWRVRGSVTLRNRKYLRLYTPHIARSP